ncbi:hypothetical protein M8J76_006642 [Diaphorina citri]|nr:hypothetical protein M8J76_006642 [Diaphorina citri]
MLLLPRVPVTNNANLRNSTIQKYTTNSEDSAHKNHRNIEYLAQCGKIKNITKNSAKNFVWNKITTERHNEQPSQYSSRTSTQLPVFHFPEIKHHKPPAPPQTPSRPCFYPAPTLLIPRPDPASTPLLPCLYPRLTSVSSVPTALSCPHLRLLPFLPPLSYNHLLPYHTPFLTP